jgi:hypothetical protein
MINDAYEIPEYSQFDYEPLSVPSEKLRLTLPFILVSFLAGLVSFGLYFSVGKIAAIVPIGIWAVLIVLVSPRAGVVLALMLQVWDLTLNPERGSGYDWISVGRVLPIISFLAYLRFLVRRRPAVKSVKTSILLFSVFVFWGFCLILLAELKLLALVSVLKIFIQVLLLLVAVDLLSGRRVLEQILFLMVVGGVTGALYALFGGFTVQAVETERLMLAGMDVNALADSTGLAIVAAVALLALRRSVITIPVVIVSIIGMSLVALRMGTRAVVVGVPLAVIAGMLLGYWRKVHKLFIYSVFVILLLGSSMWWALQTGFISGNLRERVLGVFESQTYQTNVRTELWKDALQIYLEKPQGAGPGNEPLAYLTFSKTLALESHTVFFSVLVEYNLIGLAIFLGGFFALVIAVLRIRDPALRCGAGMVLAYCFLTAMATSILETRFFWQPIMLTMMIVETDFRTRSSPLDSYEGETIETFEAPYKDQMVWS